MVSSELRLALTQIASIVIDPHDSQNIYSAVTGTGVFKSTNGGKDWELIIVGLTSLKVSQLALDPLHPETIYVSTRGDSLFVSHDAGEHWQ